jgi:hypothetical protein
LDKCYLSVLFTLACIPANGILAEALALVAEVLCKEATKEAADKK